MSEHYYSLLDATIGHLESLKKEGILYLNVQAGTLNDLEKPAQKISVMSVVQPQRLPPAQEATRLRPVEQPADIIPRTVLPANPIPARIETPSIIAEPNPPKLSKEVGIAALKKKVSGCVKCPNLVAARRNVVFGVGDINAALMFVGEAPGADEDLKGEPFVGAAGQLLTRIIGAMGLSRESVYIANILKCRPDTPGQTSGNRKPTPAEMKTCLPYLREQIELIAPRMIVALGATAVEGLLGRAEGISRLRGNFQSFQGIPVMPTYHPAYLLHKESIREKRKVWEDMLQVMEKLGVPISEKQRGYFLFS